MAKAKAKGSIILEILIVILIVALIATILYPKKIWRETENQTKACRNNMDRLLKAELVYQSYNNNTYTDSIQGLVSFFKEDTTKKSVRDYFRADTTLAETMVKFLRDKDEAADLVVRNLFADTLMFAIVEAVKYDSNLARVMLNRLEFSPLADSIAAKRATDSSDVVILKQLDKEYAGIDIYEPMMDDDSLKLVFHRMMPEVPTGSLLDSLYSLNESWAEKIDSAVFYTMDNFTYCPTVNREYKLTVIDTSAIKFVNIECPIDSTDIEQNKSDFVKYYFGHRRIANHGKIEQTERSWSK